MVERPTNRELSEALRSATDRIVAQDQRIVAQDQRIVAQDQIIKTMQQKMNQLEGMLEIQNKMTNYYANPNAPPSADSLEWKKQKRQKAKEKKDTENTGSKPGGKKGHKGVSRKHNPEKTQQHKFERKRVGGKIKQMLPRCGCGMDMIPGDTRSRDMIDIEIITNEIRHLIETGICPHCNKTEEAPNDLPRHGSYGKKLIGMIAEIRAARVPLHTIPVIIKYVSGIGMSASTASNIMARIGDAVADEAAGIMKKVEESPHAGFDETGYRDNGTKKWATVAQSGKNIAITINSSRTTYMLDAMDKFYGVATTDGFKGYNKFHRDYMHQFCWAHELRQAKYLAQKYGVPDDKQKPRQQYYEDLCQIFAESKKIASSGARLKRNRDAMNLKLYHTLSRYRDTDDAELRKILERMGRHHHGMFAFLEHPGVEPTNNASERALRYLVVFRKISGQTKGGVLSMKRLADFVTCVLTWRAHGRSVGHEIARLI